MMTGSLKKKKLKDFFFFNFKKRGGPLIRACSLIRSNTVPGFKSLLLPFQSLCVIAVRLECFPEKSSWCRNECKEL